MTNANRLGLRHIFRITRAKEKVMAMQRRVLISRFEAVWNVWNGRWDGNGFSVNISDRQIVFKRFLNGKDIRSVSLLRTISTYANNIQTIFSVFNFPEFCKRPRRL